MSYFKSENEGQGVCMDLFGCQSHLQLHHVAILICVHISGDIQASTLVMKIYCVTLMDKHKYA